MFICQCGCNKEIPPVNWHKTHPPKFIKGHNTQRGEHLYARYSAHRVPPGTLCACGCGGLIPEYKQSGGTRYQRAKNGNFYLPKHCPRIKGTNSHKWKGGRWKNNLGYIFIYIPDHPEANKDGYVLEHRYVWEQVNGPLKSNEVVHHINGVRDDNRIENLIAITRADHSKYHITQHDGFKKTKQQRSDAGKLGAAARWRKPI
jgi:hypothetical protein